MSIIPVLSESYSKKILFLFNFSGALVAFTIPFHLLFNSYLIVCFFFFFLLNVIYKNFTLKRGSTMLFFIFISFFLMEIISFVYSENKNEGIFILQKKSSLLAFPLILAFINEVNVRIIFKGFIAGCILAVIICLTYACSSFLKTSNFDIFFNEQFSQPLHAHPVYFSLHLSFALLILLDEVNSFSTFTFIKKIIIIATLALLLIAIFFLSARTILFTLTSILFYKIFFVFLRKKKISIKISIFLLLTSLGYISIYFSPVMKSRIMEIVNSKLYFSPEENNATSLTLRIVKWQCSIEGIKQYPLSGVGVGDAQDFLQNCYDKKNFWGNVFHFNSHNQYLQIGLAAGSIAIVLYLLALFFPLYKSIRQKNHLYIEFLILIIFLGLTESFLERQHGVVFYSFFNSLFVFHKSK